MRLNIKNNKKNSVLGGLIWSFGERITAQLVSLVVSIVLARLLSPDHYGIISIVAVFITLCNVFVSSGFGSAVVQKKDVTDEDFNTCFIIGFVISIILYLLIFIFSPAIARFYNMPELCLVMRVMGIRIIVASVNNIQHAYIQKNMQFKKFFFATLFGTVISAIVGIVLAYKNFGVWALVAQYLTNTIIDTIVLLFVGGWIPKLQFKLEKAKKLFSFGSKVLVTNLVVTLEGNIRSLIVGKVFGPSDLAYYDQGNKYPSLLVTNVNNSINKVMLPVFSEKQDNLLELKKILRKSIKIGTYLLGPLLVGFAAISTNFVKVMLTDKWLFCVPYIQIFCFVYLTRPLETSCHQALLAIGRSDIVMKIILVINVTAIATLLIAIFVFRSVLLIALGSLFSSLVSITLFMTVICKKLNYLPKEQVMDIGSSLIISLVMGIIVYVVGTIPINKFLLLTIQVLFGATIYFILSVITKNDSYDYVKTKLLNTLIKIKNLKT